MPAFLIVRCRIRDREAFRAYALAAAELTQRMGGEYLVRGAAAEVLEQGLGPYPALVAHVVSRWPTRLDALEFWNSPQYAAIRAGRADCADAEVVLLEGVA